MNRNPEYASEIAFLSALFFANAHVNKADETIYFTAENALALRAGLRLRDLGYLQKSDHILIRWYLPGDFVPQGTPIPAETTRAQKEKA